MSKAITLKFDLKDIESRRSDNSGQLNALKIPGKKLYLDIVVLTGQVLLDKRFYRV
ncbi:MAG: hypothetical protein V7L00_13975 [Nostoc sp.]|uniref:hypothetical protein n=1 Tax=Nostoc sp. TaxID=1180 RepID=UPI002FF8E741